MTPIEAAAFVHQELSAIADPERVPAMAAYLKTDSPFYGVAAPPRKQVERELKKHMGRPADVRAYQDLVMVLWAMPHREAKYVALTMAQSYRRFMTITSMPMYELIIREGAWWDLIDGVATNCLGGVLKSDPEPGYEVLDEWITDPDMWIRRSAIISQNRLKDATDERRLFAYCERHLSDKEFFIRKAIGWALRDYARVAPDAVIGFEISLAAKRAFIRIIDDSFSETLLAFKDLPFGVQGLK